MKIIHYIDSLGMGGGQVMMAELRDALAAQIECKQEIWLGNPSKVEPEFIRSYNIDYKTGNMVRLSQLNKNTLGKPTILIYHKLMSSDARLTTIAFKKMPVIVINHTQMGTRRPVGKCNALVSVSKYMHQISKKIHRNHNNVFIRNGVSQKYCQSVDPYERQDSDAIVTGRINRICKIKHSEKWIDFIFNIEAPRPLVHEYIGSEGKHSNKYQKAKARNVISFLGGIFNRQEKIARLKSWDFFLYHINETEGTSMSVLEALACGVPVFCNDKPGNNEIIEKGVNGFVYRKFDEIAKKINDVYKTPGYFSLLKASTSANFAEKLDSRYMASAYMELINSMV